MLKGLIISLTVTTGYLFTTAPTTQPDSLAESLKRGKQVYAANCQSCHMETGEGVPGVFPPLAKSENLMKDPKRAINAVVHGVSGEITVNGQKYNMDMPAQSHLSDEEVADVVNYIQNNWGNKAKAVTPAQVKAARKQQ
ncbi:cytochrome c [Pontibacter korlensis]|uniref:Major anaerobically induced transmembrane protein n=1 Tax=Pontibacter korlensis TaxID=400092 RepID=A0A0E3ZHU3_9BACT|nr:cytochrome c [Pontibacter korlensis]AKD04214.1 major anaerobically induced transmembrane protein [Pontibacter korlensis]